MKIAFEIMLYGMGGIFAATLIIMFATYLLRKADSFHNSK